ncbi:IS66 family insertion sequence element accessory protein TnpB [Mesorhizobium sp. BHbsci]
MALDPFAPAIAFCNRRRDRMKLLFFDRSGFLRKWIKKRVETQSLSLSSPPAFIPVQIESAADQALSRQSSIASVDLPATCDESVGGNPKGLHLFPLQPR